MENKTSKKKLFLKIFTHILGAIFIVICGIIIYFNLTHEYHIVEGSSMVPTLNYNGSTDGVFVSKVKSYKRGDIIVTKIGELNENNSEKIVIKRLIAIGGDKITIREVDGVNRIVLIYFDETNEIILEEPYLLDYYQNAGLKTKFQEMITEQSLELDDDGFLTIAEDEIFFLGDNRVSSRDCLKYGPKKKSMVVGLVDYIAYGNKYIYWQVIKQVFGG